ncbi:peroxiredoxin [Actinorhabdospora filicis]|uniref:Peroxiredoxin n=1 Tax=Actinorhabdospora filicis TaxID=1785913 RepID=A0A9W6SRV5_9ACTN|nr:OsmC family peroxiredoxin [Actinorhabdospora filicis]GLZ81764.1 peroxiredoxin [Actinorhabdospora filicis]
MAGTVRTAHTNWTGTLLEGSGVVHFDSSNLASTDVTWASRATEANGLTSPEELIAAAHSSCFSMAFSAGLTKAGTPPTALETTAEVTFVPGTGITGIALSVVAEIPGISEEDFQAAAQAAKEGCPVSKALAATPITITATLK